MTGRFPPGVDVPEAFFNLQNEVGPEGLFNLQNDEVGDESGCRMSLDAGMEAPDMVCPRCDQPYSFELDRDWSVPWNGRCHVCNVKLVQPPVLEQQQHPTSSGEDRWRFASGALPGLLLPPPPLSTQPTVHTCSGAHTTSPHRPAMTAVAVEEPSAHDAEPCQLTSKQSPAHRKRIQAAMAVEIAGHDAEPEGLHRLHPGARSQERGPSIAGHNAEPEGLHRLQPEARSQESGHQSLDSLTTVSSFEILDPDT